MNMKDFKEADRLRAQRFTTELLPKLTPEFLSTLRLAAELCDWAACDLEEVNSFVREMERTAKDGSKDVDAATRSTVDPQPGGRRTELAMKHDPALRAKAESACVAANGSDWNFMHSGDQEAEIDTWIDGYKSGLADASSSANSTSG